MIDTARVGYTFHSFFKPQTDSAISTCNYVLYVNLIALYDNAPYTHLMIHPFITILGESISVNTKYTQ